MNSKQFLADSKLKITRLNYWKKNCLFFYDYV